MNGTRITYLTTTRRTEKFGIGGIGATTSMDSVVSIAELVGELVLLGLVLPRTVPCMFVLSPLRTGLTG
jgi:hypothetical protein